MVLCTRESSRTFCVGQQQLFTIGTSGSDTSGVCKVEKRRKLPLRDADGVVQAFCDCFAERLLLLAAVPLSSVVRNTSGCE